MPEGDTIHYAANKIRRSSRAGPRQSERPTRASAKTLARAPRRARRGERCSAHGKHLFLRFAGDLVIHSHLRMTGSWGVFARGSALAALAAPRVARLRARGHEVVQFDGPVLELIPPAGARFDQQLAALGPDVLAPEFDRDRFLRRLREDDPTRPIGDALLDQRTVAGLRDDLAHGGLFRRGRRPVAARRGGWATTRRWPSSTPSGRGPPPVRRSAATGRDRDLRQSGSSPARAAARGSGQAGLGENNRRTYWCPTSQT